MPRTLLTRFIQYSTMLRINWNMLATKGDKKLHWESLWLVIIILMILHIDIILVIYFKDRSKKPWEEEKLQMSLQLHWTRRSTVFTLFQFLTIHLISKSNSGIQPLEPQTLCLITNHPQTSMQCIRTQRSWQLLPLKWMELKTNMKTLSFKSTPTKITIRIRLNF